MSLEEQAKELLRSEPPNIPESHWEHLVHTAVLDEKVKNNTITLTNPGNIQMVVDTMTGKVTITLQFSTNIESVNTALKAFDVPVDGWEIKA